MKKLFFVTFMLLTFLTYGQSIKQIKGLQDSLRDKILTKNKTK